MDNAALMERLRQGVPGDYEFTLVQGESYAQFERLMDEARDLAARLGAAWQHDPGSLARPDRFLVSVPTHEKTRAV